MNKNYLIVGIIGFILGLSMIPIDAAIPPTPAWKIFNVQTSPSHTNDTNVNASLYNDILYFKSDGSIWFNVTESYP